MHPIVEQAALYANCSASAAALLACTSREESADSTKTSQELERSMAQQPSFPGSAGLRSRVDEVRLKAARDLQRYVSTELRELPAERYSSSLDDINQTIYSLISSQEVHEKKGGILAIGENIE